MTPVNKYTNYIMWAVYNPFMKIEDIAFTEDEIRIKMSQSPSLKSVYHLARNMEYMKHFEVGQVLVQRNHRTGDLYKNNAGIPSKYIVVNKIGDIPICKKLMVNGKPGKGLYCPPVEAGTNGDTFEEDPDAVDAVLLGFEYDPLEFPKKVGKARERINRKNREIALAKLIESNVSSIHDDRAIASFLKSMIEEHNGRYDIWVMSNQCNKQKCTLTRVYCTNSSYKVEVHYVKDGQPTSEGRYIWSLMSTYSTSYYVEEPVTLKEELEKMK